MKYLATNDKAGMILVISVTLIVLGMAVYFKLL